MIVYRDATPADGEPLNAMARQAWTETFGDEYTADDLATYLDQAYGPTGLRAHLALPEYRYRLAIEDDRILGYAKTGALKLPAPDPQPGAYELFQLYVLKEHHGTGIAAALMDWTIDTARAANAPELYLAVFEFNHRARAFYARYGFVEVGHFDFAVGRRIDRDGIWRKTL